MEDWLGKLQEWLLAPGKALMQAGKRITDDVKKGLNKSGSYYDRFSKAMDTEYTTTALDEMGHPIMLSNGKMALRTSTPKKDIMETVAGVALPVSVATAGVPMTLGGLIGGAATGYVGGLVGEDAITALGGDENAQKMGRDFGEFFGSFPGAKYGGITGDYGDMAFNIYKNFKANPNVAHFIKDIFKYNSLPSKIAIGNKVRTNPELRRIATNKENYEKLEPTAKEVLEHPENYDETALRANVKDIVKDVAEKNGLNESNFKFLGDTRFYQDADDWGLLYRRNEGNYPLTFAERRKWITNYKNEVKEGIKFTRDETLKNSNITGTTPEKATRIMELETKLRELNDLPEKEWRELFDLRYPITIELSNNIVNLGLAFNNANFGTRVSMNKYNRKWRLANQLPNGKFPLVTQYPNDNNYIAFALKDKMYFPFRENSGTLKTNKAEYPSESYKGTGAHEYEHVVLEMHETPLIVWNNNKRYTNELLYKPLQNITNRIIDKAGTKGTWEGALDEMDAELMKWRTLYGYPKFSEMTPELQLHIISLANDRFGLNKPNSLIGDEKPLFHTLFTELEAAGYHKHGGKIKRF